MGNPLESWAAGISQRKRAGEAQWLPHLVFIRGRGPAPAIGYPGRWGRGRTGVLLGWMLQKLRRLRGDPAAPRDPPVTAMSSFHVPCHPPAIAVLQQPRGKAATPAPTGLCPARPSLPAPAAWHRDNSVGRDVSAPRPGHRRDRQRLPEPAGAEAQRERPLCPAGGGSPAPAHQCSPPGPAAAPPRRRRSSKALWWRPLRPRPASAGNRPRRGRGRARTALKRLRHSAGGAAAAPLPLRGGARHEDGAARAGRPRTLCARATKFPRARAPLHACAPHPRPRRKMAAAGRARRRWGGGGGGRSGARCLQPLASRPGKRRDRVAAARRARGGGGGGRAGGGRAGGGGEAAQARGRHLRARSLPPLPLPPPRPRRAPAAPARPRPLPAAP